MARLFDGTDDVVALSQGQAANQALTGVTVAAIVRRAADSADHVIYNIGTGSGNRSRMRLDDTNVLALQIGANSRLSTTGVAAADGWCFVCVTKASGTSVPRAHIYKYSTATWAHEAMGTGLADLGGGSATHEIGAQNAGLFFSGDIAVVGLWETATAPTDAQVEAMAFGLMPWLALPQPRGLWVLDQSSTSMKVADLTGGGANESSLTGTTVSTSAVPVWNRGAAPIGVKIASGAPTVSGVAAASFSFTATSSGTPTTFGVAASSVGFAATASGTRTTHGTAAGAYTFTGAAPGTRTTAGTAAAPLTFTATAAGARQISGTAASPFTFTATASGTPTHPGTAAASFVFTATGSGTITHPATTAANFTFTATSSGTKTVSGAAQASFGFTASATGTPTTFGTAAGTFTFLGVASGNRLVYATATGIYVFTATSTGGADVVTRNATSTATDAPKATSSVTDNPFATSTATVTKSVTSTPADAPKATSTATVTKAASSSPTDSDG